MAENGALKTIAAVVGIIGGVVGIYKAVEPSPPPPPDPANTAFVHHVGGSLRSGELEGNKLVWLTLDVQNLGKQDDALDVVAEFDGSPDLLGTGNVKGPDLLVGESKMRLSLLRPGQQAKFDFVLSPDAWIMGRDLSLEDNGIVKGGYFRLVGTLEWHDRVTGKVLNENWCLRGRFVITRDQELNSCPAE